MEKRSLRDLLDNWLQAFQLIVTVVTMIWCIAILNHISGYALNQFGLLPRDVTGLTGLAFWVLLHGDFTHVALNTMPLLFLGFFVALRGPLLYFKITLLVWIVAGLAVWLVGREAIHIGSSGLVFGYFGFLLAVAIYERSVFDLTVASVAIFYYGGLIFGVLPVDQFVSWEAHLFGLIAGVLAARLFGKDWVSRQKR